MKSAEKADQVELVEVSYETVTVGCILTNECTFETGSYGKIRGLSLYVLSDTQDQLDTLKADDNSSAARSTRSPHDFQSGGISRLLQHLWTSRMKSVRRC